MNKALFSSLDSTWNTPQDLFDRLNAEFHFNLDPAANAKSAKCEKYYSVEDDGLSKSWGGYTVFCNPPYGRDLPKWTEKGYKESLKPGTTVVMLIPARPDTSYWEKWIFGKAEEVRMIVKRLKFTDDDGNEKSAAPFPSAVVIWKSPDLSVRPTLMTSMNAR